MKSTTRTLTLLLVGAASGCTNTDTPPERSSRVTAGVRAAGAPAERARHVRFVEQSACNPDFWRTRLLITWTPDATNGDMLRTLSPWQGSVDHVFDEHGHTLVRLGIDEQALPRVLNEAGSF